MADTHTAARIDLDALDALKFADEEDTLGTFLASPALTSSQRSAALRRATSIVEAARLKGRRKGLMESFLEEFGLSNAEGLALMCLAEALLRVPDQETRDDLIAEKIRSGNWQAHHGQSDSWLVNASTLGLMLTGRVIGPPRAALSGPQKFVQSLVRESGEPVVRAAMMQAMRIMGEQFVLGRTVSSALKRADRLIRTGDAAHISVDMLGEGARTADDAARYLKAYQDAIAAITTATDSGLPPEDKSGVSVKLSALHPRYTALHEDLVMQALYPNLLLLCQQAARANINLCLDAEEANRLVISLKLLQRLCEEPTLAEWTGLGLAVQAYQKRALQVIETVDAIVANTGRRLMVRLVKGAYWDSEIKHAQEAGVPNYPVFTTKYGTDVSYITCARAMLAASPRLYPQFATHNAHTLAAVEQLATETGVTAYEFQRLHGMGEALYEAARPENTTSEKAAPTVRIYAPVGAHKDLLPYLVRRLLENGANTSFVHAFLDPDVPVEQVVADPFAQAEAGPRRHPRIPTPPRLYGPDRANSAGHDLTRAVTRQQIQGAVEAITHGPAPAAGPILSGKAATSLGSAQHAPHELGLVTGTVRDATLEDLGTALDAAQAAQPEWDARGGPARAAVLRDMANALEASAHRFIALMARETGKTLADGIAEVREAVDFLRYYAAQSEARFGAPERLPGPSGETNHLSLHGRGVFACISPWNFPLAIFTGQLAAALAAGNTVIAKPAEQSPLTAFEAVKLYQSAGLPADVLHLLPGPGETIGAALVADPRISGVCFTGGTATARAINRALADRDGPIIPLIAETGGLNAMFVDTTALREQVIDDAIHSAFGSAGQRCSALRLLFLPHDTADGLIDGLKGAMDQLKLGDPARPDTDVGPVIDTGAHAMLTDHLDRICRQATLLKQIPAPGGGTFFGPALVEIQSLDQLDHEVFGPVLHVIRYDPDDIATVGAALDAKGYGLTLGIHSRLERFWTAVRSPVKVGNTYINRSTTGAVVGVQPFGGERLSGTGPKAGGPNYLMRFATERVTTVNITAQGGDPELLSLG